MLIVSWTDLGAARWPRLKQMERNSFANNKTWLKVFPYTTIRYQLYQFLLPFFPFIPSQLLKTWKNLTLLTLYVGDPTPAQECAQEDEGRQLVRIWRLKSDWDMAVAQSVCLEHLILWSNVHHSWLKWFLFVFGQRASQFLSIFRFCGVSPWLFWEIKCVHLMGCEHVQSMWYMEWKLIKLDYRLKKGYGRWKQYYDPLHACPKSFRSSVSIPTGARFWLEWQRQELETLCPDDLTWCPEPWKLDKVEFGHRYSHLQQLLAHPAAFGWMRYKENM